MFTFWCLNTCDHTVAWEREKMFNIKQIESRILCESAKYWWKRAARAPNFTCSHHRRSRKVCHRCLYTHTSLVWHICFYAFIHWLYECYTCVRGRNKKKKRRRIRSRKSSLYSDQRKSTNIRFDWKPGHLNANGNVFFFFWRFESVSP